MEHYRHTQVSAWSRLLLLAPVGAVGLAILGIQRAGGAPPAALAILAAVAALLTVLAVLFTSLTTIVTDTHVDFHFGLRFWRTRLPLAEVVSIDAVRNRWWYGFGIRYTPHGWLFNVWGLDAVEIRLASGRTLRVGTDEPAALVDAVERLR